MPRFLKTLVSRRIALLSAGVGLLATSSMATMLFAQEDPEKPKVTEEAILKEAVILAEKVMATAEAGYDLKFSDKERVSITESLIEARLEYHKDLFEKANE